MTIDKNKVVTLHYTLKKDGPEGPLIEETVGGDPMSFIFGIGQMIPGFEANLIGKAKGDKYAFLLGPGEAYGDLKSDSIVEVPISNFLGQDGELDRDSIRAGASIRMKNQNGQSFQGVVVESSLTSVKVDFNHPMAGQSLNFSGEILDVRDATDDELHLGHVYTGTES